MLTAVCNQFARSGYDIVVPVDARHPTLDLPATFVPVHSEPDLLPTLLHQAEQVDEILVIAPETDGCLVSLLHHLAPHRSKLLNPDLNFTTLAADKNRMQLWLRNHGVPTPLGSAADQWGSLHVEHADQIVLKPADGCGGSDICILNGNIDQRDILAKVTGERPTDDKAIRRLHQWRIEELVPGVPASVSVVRNTEPTKLKILPPLRQVFHVLPFGKFSHCLDDLSEELVNRARQLAKQTIDALPCFAGFIGIDMVLGDRDVVIEINPRITMSYCTLANVAGLPIGNSIVTNSQNDRLTTA